MNSEIDFGGDFYVPSFSISGSTTLVAIPQPDHGQVEGDVNHVAPDDREVEFLSAFGFPLAARWNIEAGAASALNDWWTIGGSWPVVYLLHWPLVDGKRWSGTFMGRSLEFVAQEIENGYQIEATYEGSPVMAYTYDPAVRWFREFRILDGAGGIALEAVLEEHGHGYQGQAFVTDINGSESTGCLGQAGSLPASPGICGYMPLTAYSGGDVSFRIHFAYKSEGPGTAPVVRQRPESGTEAWHLGVCPCDERLDVIEDHPEPGVHVWLLNDLMSGDRWSYFIAYSRCFQVLDIDGSSVERVAACSTDW